MKDNPLFQGEIIAKEMAKIPKSDQSQYTSRKYKLEK
jgi:hypothetical protein